MNLSQISSLTEDQARAYFERIRWPNGRICPHCGSVESKKLEGKAHRAGLYKCSGCGGQFTATINTIMEDSHLPIRTWLMAFSILCSAKKGVSALQLQRQLGLGSYRSAWHLAHRIRHAMAREPLKGLLGVGGGTVEVDESYVGGKPRKHAGPRAPGTRRPNRKTTKTPVVGLVERGGRVRAHVIPNLTAETLKAACGQRLAKKLCGFCKEPLLLTDQMVDELGLPDVFCGHSIYRAGPGCAQCNQLGYAGRQAIIEVLPITDEVTELIMQRDLTSIEIANFVYDHYQVPSLRDLAFGLLYQGVIDPLGVTRHELYRATKLGQFSIDLPLAANDPAMARRVLFVTGDVAGTDAERFLEESGCRWLAKPFRLKDLLRVAKEMVESSFLIFIMVVMH